MLLIYYVVMAKRISDVITMLLEMVPGGKHTSIS